MPRRQTRRDRTESKHAAERDCIESKHAAREAAAKERLNKPRSECVEKYLGKDVISRLCVPLKVWRNLHERFDLGEANVCTGKKDGTNRPVTRLADGRILEVLPNGSPDIEGRELLPQEWIMADIKDVQAMTRHGQATVDSLLFTKGKDASVEYIYDKDKNIAGCLALSGTLYLGPQKAPKKEQTCDVCGGAAAKKCSRCRTSFFCSRACQEAGWAAHRGSCAFNGTVRDMYEPPAAAGEYPFVSSAKSGLFRRGGVPFVSDRVKIKVSEKE